MPTDATGNLFSALMSMAFSVNPPTGARPGDFCDETLSDDISPAELSALMSATTIC